MDNTNTRQRTGGEHGRFCLLKKFFAFRAVVSADRRGVKKKKLCKNQCDEHMSSVRRWLSHTDPLLSINLAINSKDIAIPDIISTSNSINERKRKKIAIRTQARSEARRIRNRWSWQFLMRTRRSS